MDIVEAILLGLVQGLTEFFPVSSSGHLVLVHDLFGIEASMFFDIMLHVGTLIAVFAVFYKDILGLFKPPFNKLALLALASVPAALVGFLLSDKIEGLFQSGKLLPFFFLITAALLLTAELVAKRRKTLPQPLGPGRTLIMGCAQACALIPGISRSGSTIAAGILSGAEKEKVARFSFLMSIPVILGSALMEGVGLINTEVADINVISLLAGMAAAAISGFFAIKLMLKLIGKNNYKWFAVYLAALSIFTFVNYYII